MDKEKALLLDGESVIDVSGCIQIVTAHDKDTGELKYRGNGIVAFRPQHVRGNAVIFLKYKGRRHIFGELVSLYGMSEWSCVDYAKFDMRAPNMDRMVIDNINNVSSL